MMLLIFEELFEGIEVCSEGLFAFFCGEVGGVGLAPHKLLLYLDIFGLFQGLEVAGKVAIGHLQDVLEVIEVHAVLYHEGRHDPQAHLALKGLVKLM